MGPLYPLSEIKVNYKCEHLLFQLTPLSHRKAPNNAGSQPEVQRERHHCVWGFVLDMGAADEIRNRIQLHIGNNICKRRI